MERCPLCGKMTASHYGAGVICYSKECHLERWSSGMKIVVDEKYPMHVKYVKKPPRRIEINDE